MAAFAAAALLFFVTLTPSQAQDVALAEIQSSFATLPANAEAFGDMSSFAGGASAGSQPALTAAVLAAYVARQQAQKAAAGAAPAAPGSMPSAPVQPQLTSEIVSAYAAAHLQNAALAAIDTAAAPPGTTAAAFSIDGETALFSFGNSSIDADELARYARHGFVPTVKKVAYANKERNCLSTAIYHEARGESTDGQWAVANVIINRAMSKRFPGSMCGVVFQNADAGKFHCQFTFACDGHSDRPTEYAAWLKASKIAAAAYSEYQQGKRPGVVPGSALYYHTASVSPGWSNMKRVAQIGAHVFYAPL
ncbi:MAG TPA: cell wall hydrolase [Devosia sp.]|nr:cell wall hydrolase [Devosia sp.]